MPLGSVKPSQLGEKQIVRLNVAVHHAFSVRLWRLDLRTREYRKILGSSYVQECPQYSPDGRRIALNSTRSGEYGVWTCEADAENCQQLASFAGSIGGTPRWSPDGRWIAFDSRAEGESQIYVISSDGGAQRRLTSGDAENLIPSWSRDGRWIYFQSHRSGQWRVWKAPAGGGEEKQVASVAAASACISFRTRIRSSCWMKPPG
jgi:Tol biopolymer transport system component